MPSSSDVLEAVRPRLVGETAEIVGIAQLLVGDVEPAQPAGLVARRSRGSRRRPTGAPPFPGTPVFEDRLDVRLEVGRQRGSHTSSAILTSSLPLLSPV